MCSGSAIVPASSTFCRECSPMTDGASHTVNITATSLDELREALGITGDLKAGEIDLGSGIVLTNTSVVKSSGFDTTAYVLQGIMTIATGTTTSLLVAYLKDRLLNRPNVSATVDGKAVKPAGATE